MQSCRSYHSQRPPAGLLPLCYRQESAVIAERQRIGGNLYPVGPGGGGPPPGTNFSNLQPGQPSLLPHTTGNRSGVSYKYTGHSWVGRGQLSLR